MKRTMTTALVLSLLAGTSAYAADSSMRDRLAQLRAERADKREERAETKEERREAKAERREERVQRREDHLASPPPRRSERAEEVLAQVRARKAERAEVRQDRREDRREDRQERFEDRREARGGEQRVIIGQQRVDRDRDDDRRERTYSFRRPGEGRALRHRDQGRSWYDASRYRRTYYAPHRYRLSSRYIYPSGWYSWNWGFGDRLPFSSWYSHRYYLDWWRYGLPRPPIGTEWIRMRDDAILVDIWSGRVLAVYYDLFW